MLKQIIKLGGILCLITFVVVLLLGSVNHITKDLIAQNLEKAENDAREELVKADSFVEIGEDIFRGTSGEEVIGYCVKLTTKGYGGDMILMVGFDKELAVSGIKIIEHSETAGLGAKAAQPEFSDKLKGKKPELKISGGGGDDEVDAISGATISTKAVVSGINEAFGLLQKLVK